jgi:2-dehydro-3-deoxyphosphogluconate aldolase / (4S)-4-hydroxy-2-oxoglutarate aldolase
MTMTGAMERILRGGVVAIMRADSPDQLLEAAKAVLEGGVEAIEVTMTTPGALDVVKAATSSFGNEVLFGVGSVLDPETARAAILAGAQFVVCPTFKYETVQLCQRYSVPVVPGAYTPTEILSAWEAGADAVKVFPASAGGPAYVKAVKAPLPQVRLSAVGGVTVENAAAFIKAGADFVGVGGELVNRKLLASGSFGAITERARAFRAQVEQGQSK